MKTYLIPILLAVTLGFSSCVYLVNNAVYGTNCETCEVLDYWGEVIWCDQECYGLESKERMRERCEELAQEQAEAYCSCGIKRDDEDGGTD